MSDATERGAGEVPPEPAEEFLDGSEPVGDDADTTTESSQALMPSDLEEPALTNGVSGDGD